MESLRSPSSHLILVTGPARSGKSEWAESLAVATKQTLIYIATATTISNDVEWQERIEKHRSRRDASWNTVEVPVELAVVIRAATPTECLLVDSLGTWLANLLEQENGIWENTQQDLLNALQETSATLILVAEETGWGVVPSYPMGRTFRDRLGNLTRKVGAIADVVYLVTGGCALNLSQLGTRLP